MKKILFYINTLGLDGAERVVANLCNQFSQDEFNVYLVTSFPKAKEYQTNPSVNRYYLEKKEIVTNFLKRNYTRTKKLRNIIKTIKPDVVVSFMAEPNFRAITACLGLAIPVVISVRNAPDKEYSGKMNILRSANEAVEMRHHQQSLNSSVIIRPDGSVRLDCTMPFSIGNVFERKFSDIWREKGNTCWNDSRVESYINDIEKHGCSTMAVNHMTPDIQI